MNEDVSKSRRAFAQALAASPVALTPVPARSQSETAGGQKVLRYAFRVAESGFDPAQVQDLYSNTVLSNILDAPLTYDFLARPAVIVPNTAAALPQLSDDFTTLTLRIRPGIFFQDHPAFGGRPRELVAADYVYSIKRYFDPRYKSPRLYLLENAQLLGMADLRSAALKGGRFDYDREVEGVRALDRFTLQLRFARPSPRFHQYLADNSFMGAVAREVVENYDDKQIMAHPVGTGPFRLVDWRRSSRIVLERNPGYRSETYRAQPEADDDEATQVAARLAGRRLPMIDRVEIFIVEENQPRWLAFLNGEHDLVDEIPVDLANLIVPNGQLAPNLARRGVQMDRTPRPSVDMALFNMEHPLVGGHAPQQVALRRAISLAYSVDDEIRLVRKGQSVPSQSPVAPLTTGFDPTFRSEMSEFNPARAKALLDAFGYVDRNGDGWRERPDGTPLVLEMATQPDQLSRQLDELWRKAMTAIGIDMQFRSAKWPENLKNSRAGKLMMWRVGWSATQPDGDTFLALGYGPNKGQANHARFDLPAFNRLYALQQTLPDGPEREAAFFDAKKLFVAYAPYKFLGHRIDTSVAHPWVVGYRRHPFMRDFLKYIDIVPEANARTAA
ncbi:MAG TPA: ABC transporter substrate-binding protein [Burkholderiaceae bacterium]|nr:ABC transporter substrate-binding protein [Burkholderiaceae bacterium]